MHGCALKIWWASSIDNLMISIKDLHTFHCDVFAEEVIMLQSREELYLHIESGLFSERQPLLLGGGSNVLILENKIPLVVINRISGREVIREDEEITLIKLGSGENWHQFVAETLELGLNGIENLALIPGTCGAAPIQNIGAYGVELKDVLYEVEAVDKWTGKTILFDNAACMFGYRNSVFKNQLKGRYFILSVTLALRKDGLVNTHYGDILHYINASGGNAPVTPRQVFDAVVAIRKEKLPNPNKIGNAGSFFKNPIIEMELFEQIKTKVPTIPGYRVDESSIKVPAAFLLEYCGFKGKRLGETGCHARQPLVLINWGNATGAEIKQFSEQIQQMVSKTFGIELEPEINFV